MTEYPVTLIFADGVARSFDAPAGENLVDAAKRAGYTLLVDCCEGHCGTCMGTVLAGGVELGHYDPYTLVDEDREAGTILPCASTITRSCVVELPYDFSECMAAEAEPQGGRIAALEQVAQETLRLEVDVDAPLDFLPGQYVHLEPPGAGYRRSFSMANAPGATRLVFYVRTIEGGQFTAWLTGQARVGDTLLVGAPRGAFFLRGEDRPRLFVAGGTGLAPILSMLAMLARDPAAAAGGANEILVGARSGGHLFAQDELERLAAQVPNARLRYAVEADPRPGCHTGRVTELLDGLGADPAPRVYLCGPPGMVDASRQALAQARVPRADVLCERFT